MYMFDCSSEDNVALSPGPSVQEMRVPVRQTVRPLQTEPAETWRVRAWTGMRGGIAFKMY